MSLEGQQIGRYQLQHLLGTGGMGEVYLATDTHIKRNVAIKVMRTGTTTYPNAEAGKEAARLFQREMRAIAVLDHPHILPLFDYGEERDITYMVMPYRQEGSLADWLQKQNTYELLSPQVVGHIVSQAASALQYAHNQQIIHQDVKPSNFLIRSNEEKPNLPNLLLADFGVAKFSSATSNLSHTIRGTPAYMAPEQWEGMPVVATDQYALAIMAYELLVGHPPFQGGMGQMMYQHFHIQPQPPSTQNPHIPQELDPVLARALAKKPEERFPSIYAFAEAFQTALQQALQSTNEPTKARPLPLQQPELHATLAISQEEALTGTRRTLTLPGGRKVTVPVPAHVQNGQIIRLGSQGGPPNSDLEGTLSITIAITSPKAESRPLVNRQQADDKTYFSNSSIRKEKPAVRVPGPPINQPAPKRRRGLSRGMTVLLIVLALLVVSGGGYGAFYFIRGALLPNPYPPNTGTLAIDDSFSGNTFTWPQGNDVSGSCEFVRGAYDINVPPQSAHLCTNGSSNFSNFAYEIRMTIVKGDLGGIGFRASSNYQQAYYFLIGQDGSYELDLYTDHHQKLKSGTSPVINTGLNQSNLIAVVANGSTIDLYVNLHHIDSVSDSTYTTGQIGVVAYSTGDPTEVTFNDAKVWGL